jgi:signal transduction histidine kinase/CheY-like chemotaxis protein
MGELASRSMLDGAKKSISQQLFKAVFGLYCVISIVVTLVQINEEYNDAQKTISLELESYQLIFGPVLSKALWDLDLERIDDIVDGMTQVPVIVGVKIDREQNGEMRVVKKNGLTEFDIQAAKAEETTFTSLTENNLFSHQFPIYFTFLNEKRRLGAATIYSSSKVVLKRVELGFVLLVVNALIKGVALWLIFSWMSRRILVRPLHKLTDSISSLNFDNLSSFNIDLGMKTHNELSFIEQAFTKMVAELAHAKSDIMELNKTLEQRVAERTSALLEAKTLAEDSANAKIEFLARMSHEIRTPMNGVLGMLSLLISNRLDDGQLERALIAQGSASSLLDIINDILDFSKIDAHKLELDNTEFDLRRLVSSVAEAQELQAEVQGLDIIVDTLELDHLKLLGDSSRIRQIITNLLSNAIKFTTEGGLTLKVSTHDLPSGKIELQIKVSDTGLGIPKDKMAALFDPFSQVDASTTRQYGGTGLGLAIVKKLCELMDGGISVTSVVGQGSVFTSRVSLDKVPQGQTFDSKVLASRSVFVAMNDQQTGLLTCRQLHQWGATAVSGDSKQTELSIEAMLLSGHDASDFETLILDSRLINGMSNVLINSISKFKEFGLSRLILVTPMGPNKLPDALLQVPDCTYLTAPLTAHKLHQAFSQNEQSTACLSDSIRVISSSRDGECLLNEVKSDQEAINVSPVEHLILVVDDNTINQLVAEGILSQLGYKVDIAVNGKEALDKIMQSEHAPYSAVLMDCQMPVMDGYEATKRLRAGEAGDKYNDIVIIAMTANAMKGDKERCLDTGMNDYLAKPIEPENLIKVLGTWLS